MSETFDCADPLARERGLRLGVTALRRSELVVMPTDTVYGIAADAFLATGVASLLAVKGRGRDMPVPVLVGSMRTLDAVAQSVPPAGRALVEEFWPGPLTIVVWHTPHLAWDLGDTRGTVAVRMPDHPVALDLLEATGPLAVSSANRTGRPPAASAADARDQLGDEVSVYLDAGPCASPVASSIVDLTGDRPVLLRAGALPVPRLRQVVPDLVDPAEAAGPP